MEVVVAFAKRHEGGEDVVSGRVAVIERLISEPVGQRVDAESGLLNKEDPEEARVDKASEPVAPPEPGNHSWEDKSHGQNGRNIVLVLEDHDGVLVKIGDVGAAESLGVLFHHHPSNVRVQETLTNGIRVLFGVSVAMMGTVATGPPPDGAFDSTSTDKGEINLERERGGIRGVGPQTVVATRDTDSGVKIVDHCPNGGLPLQRHIECEVETDHWYNYNEVYIEPIDVFVPIGQSHW
jgi:hypothetical protein